ncbi:MAG: DUF378 domain-containing protein [archaeon]
MERNAFGWVTIILVIVGAINWGLVGLVNFNLVDLIFGAVPWLMNTVYVLVGLSGIWELVMLFR